MARTVEFAAKINMGGWNSNAKKMEKDIHGIGKAAAMVKTGAAAGVGAVKGLFSVGSTLLTGSAAYGALKLVKAGIAEAQDAVKVEMNLQRALKGVGIEYANVKGAIDKRAGALSNYLDVDDDDVKRTLSGLVEGTKSYEKSIQNLPLALDAAARFQGDFAKGARVVSFAIQGNAKALREFGIVVPKGLKGMKASQFALSEMHRLFDGSALAEKMRNPFGAIETAWKDLLQTFGETISPPVFEMIQKAADALKGLDKEKVKEYCEVAAKGLENVGKAAFEAAKWTTKAVDSFGALDGDNSTEAPGMLYEGARYMGGGILDETTKITNGLFNPLTWIAPETSEKLRLKAMGAVGLGWGAVTGDQVIENPEAYIKKSPSLNTRTDSFDDLVAAGKAKEEDAARELELPNPRGKPVPAQMQNPPPPDKVGLQNMSGNDKSLLQNYASRKSRIVVYTPSDLRTRVSSG